MPVITEEMATELARYERQWVALSRDNLRIVDTDTSLAALAKRIDVSGEAVTYMKVPRTDAYLSFPL